MLKELKFVQGAVAKKDFVPAMTHFKIEGGRVRSFNGSLALCSPIPFDIDCTPKADALVRAISNCKETTTMHMTDGGKLSIKSGSFRVFVETVDDPSSHVEPAGEVVQFDGAVLLQALKTIYDFIGDDASRPWCNGVLLKGMSAYATNNASVIEYWIGTEAPVTVNIPRAAVKEMIRINEAPTHAQMDENSVTFHYEDGRWIRTQLLGTEWPDLAKILDKPAAHNVIDPQLFDGLDMLLGFSDDVTRAHISEGFIRTHKEDNVGATYEVSGLGIEGIYSIKLLKLLQGVATHADFTNYPQPALFFGNRLRGALVGMTG